MRELIVTENITLDGVIDAARRVGLPQAQKETRTNPTYSMRFANSVRLQTRCSWGG